MGGSATAVKAQLADVVELSKPRIALVVLVTTFAGMWLAAGPALAPSLVLATLAGVWLASASAGMLNNFLDRDIDAVMGRTAQRAIPAGRVHPDSALYAGLALAALSFLVMAAGSNLFAATLTVATIYLYVVVYTLWLKRSTELCTEIGGIAGALPPVIGWSAVTGDVGVPALLLFLILFLWQPPHFWVLAMLRTEDYARAGIPMLPVAAGPLVTRAKIVLYTAALLPAVMALFYVGAAGLVFAMVALAATLGYLLLTIDFVRRPAERGPGIRLFLVSIGWLLTVFTAVFFDSH